MSAVMPSEKVLFQTSLHGRIGKAEDRPTAAAGWACDSIRRDQVAISVAFGASHARDLIVVEHSVTQPDLYGPFNIRLALATV